MLIKIRTLVAVAALAITTAAASASPITGTISIAGNDSFDNNGITFTPTTGTVYQADGTLSAFAPADIGGITAGYLANLTSFSFNAASGVTVFSVKNIVGQVATFTIDQILSKTLGTDSNGPTLSLSGLGYFNETGHDTTSGTFSLTSSSAGQITGFQLVSSNVATTPEPSSLLLLGTGLTGVAGVLRRRLRRS